MGAWDASLFGADDASDVRNDYIELIEDGVSDADAQAQVLAEHLVPEHPEMNYTVWLALAATQLAWGRLDEAVKTQALSLIDSGAALDEWRELGASRTTLAKRAQVLDELRERLKGPRPDRVEIKPRKHETRLRQGAVLGYRAPVGYFTFYVVDAHVTRTDIAPVLDALPGPTRRRPTRLQLWWNSLPLQAAAQSTNAMRSIGLRNPCECISPRELTSRMLALRFSAGETVPCHQPGGRRTTAV